MIRLAFCFLFTFIACASGSASADDWATWRGDSRDGISKETGLLESWPEGGPAKVWTSTAAGIGYSSMSVVGDTIYTMGADGDQEYLIAISAQTGEEKWKSGVGPRLGNGWGDGPRSTPTVVGDKVIGLAGEGRLACANAYSGDILWTAEMKALGGKVPNWGYSESVLVDGDRVLCTPGGKNGSVACFNLQSGEKIWQSAEMTENAHYSSIIKVQHAGAKQYIQLTMKKVFGLDADGKLLWQADWPNGRTAVIPTPIYHEGHVYITSGYGAGCALYKVDDNNNVEELYANKTMSNHHGGVVLLDGHIYGHSNSGGWVCQELETGDMVWNEKRKLGKGSMAYADGKFYCLDKDSGDCVLLDATPDGWEEAGRFTLTPQTEKRVSKGRIWSHPVVANGRLYLRDQEIINCYDIKK